MRTLSNTSATRLPLLMDDRLATHFVAGSLTPVGSLVSIDHTTGKVAPVAATNKFPHGIAVTQGKVDEDVTVALFAIAVVDQALSSPVDAGTVVTISGIDAEGNNKYAAADTGDIASGVALAEGTTGDRIKIAIFYTPFQVPA